MLKLSLCYHDPGQDSTITLLYWINSLARCCVKLMVICLSRYIGIDNLVNKHLSWFNFCVWLFYRSFCSSANFSFCSLMDLLLFLWYTCFFMFEFLDASDDSLLLSVVASL